MNQKKKGFNFILEKNKMILDPTLISLSSIGRHSYLLTQTTGSNMNSESV